MFAIPKRTLSFDGTIAPSFRSMKKTREFAADEVRCGTLCCARASRPTQRRAAETSRQARVIDHMNRSDGRSSDARRPTFSGLRSEAFSC